MDIDSGKSADGENRKKKKTSSTIYKLLPVHKNIDCFFFIHKLLTHSDVHCCGLKMFHEIHCLACSTV